jgi:hypothetical protein
MDICAQQAPPDIEVMPGHVSACWLHAKDAEHSKPANPGPIPLITASQHDSRPPRGESP